MKIILSLLLLLSSSQLLAQEDYSFQVLLPLDHGVVTPGAFGSEWDVELWISNSSDEPIRVNPCGIILACQFPGTGPTLPARISWQNFLASTKAPTGRVFFLRQSEAANVHFSLRLYERSEGLVRQGIEIPVVRETGFETGVAELLPISVTDDQRVALRIYDPDAATPEEAASPRAKQILLEVLTNEHLSEPTVLAQETLTFQRSGDDPQDLVTEPAVIELFSLTERYPAIAAAGTVRLRLTPLTEGLSFWAMASITDNDNQYVSLVTPK